MGTIRKGANGGFSGKAGSVFGSSWRVPKPVNGAHSIPGGQVCRPPGLIITACTLFKEKSFYRADSLQRQSSSLELKHVLQFKV